METRDDESVDAEEVTDVGGNAAESPDVSGSSFIEVIFIFITALNTMLSRTLLFNLFRWACISHVSAQKR